MILYPQVEGTWHQECPSLIQLPQSVGHSEYPGRPGFLILFNLNEKVTDLQMTSQSGHQYRCSGPKWTYFQPGTKSISAAVLPVLGTKSILAAVLPVLDPQSVEVCFLPQLECIDIGAPDPFSNLPSRYARSTIFNSCPLLYPLFQWPICQT